jgi:hypothetical protein
MTENRLKVAHPVILTSAPLFNSGRNSSLNEEDKPVILEFPTLIASPDIRRCPNSGNKSMLERCDRPFHILSDMPHSFNPLQKFSVPSMGSRNTTKSLLAGE